MTWTLAEDSPLLPLLDGRSRRGVFEIAHALPAPLDPVPGLLAGAAEVDITPPPGLPKAGYSANAHDGNGFRTRLRARVLHLRAGRASVALVQCDLLGGSAVIQHLVAQAVADRTDVPLAGVFIGATHTHAGPGQFLGTDFYNRFASNRGGFDPAFTQWLASRIAAGVVEAHDSRRPARAAFGRREVWGLTRNRSLEPHVRNDEVTDRRTEPQRRFVNINPWLHLLRVDAERPGGRLEPLAAMVVFSVHGTGISMGASEYNADLWAYLVGELSDRIEAGAGSRAVVGAVEGTHADVAPALHPTMAGHVEARRVGRGIGAEAAELYHALDSDLDATVALSAGLREVDLRRSRAIDGVELAPRAAVGAALVAGAYENVTPVLHRVPPFRAGTPKPWRTRHPQGAKWVLGSRWLQPLVVPTRSFPEILPVQVIRIGDRAIVGLPFEVTVASGRRISAAVAHQIEQSTVTGVPVTDAPVTEVIVSSVANEYAGYVATPEEYALQHYEGGHTLYGPATQPFIAAHAARWAAEVIDHGAMSLDVATVRRFDLRIHRYLPSPPPDAAPSRRFVGTARFVEPTARDDGYWEAEWRDVAPGGLSWHEPLASVEASDDGGPWMAARSADGRPADDQGWDVEVAHLGAVGDAAPDEHRYVVRWHAPSFRAGRRHRVVLAANADRPSVAGDPFD